MNAAIQKALVFLVDVTFSLFIMAFLLRFILQLVKADFYNPISQAIYVATNPLLIPLRRIIPGFAGLDWACILVLFLIQALELSIVFFIQKFSVPNIIGLLLLTVVTILDHAVSLLFYTVIFQVILSWVNPYSQHPLAVLAGQITGPFASKIRRITPNFAGIDLTPFFMLVIIQLVNILLISQLKYLALANL